MAIIAHTSVALHKIPKDKIETKEVEVNGKKVIQKYLRITTTINDELDQFGNQASVTVTQSKEEREAKQPKTYLGNGYVGWTNGDTKKLEKQGQGQSSNQPQVQSSNQPAEQLAGEDLPF
jgi:hypothetical protein